MRNKIKSILENNYYPCKFEIGQATNELVELFQSKLQAERERFESRIDKLLQFMNTDQEIEHPHGNYYDRIIYCDGDFYWEADTEGNKPMNLNDVENLITSNPE